VRGAPKTATVMFTDLVGSTALAGRLGPPRAAQVRELHFAALRDCLAVHRGIEVKTLGDGLMAVFESVSDGVACAITMQRAVTRHNRRREASCLAMRVGLSAGDVTCVEHDYFGPPVVEASRLCAEAGSRAIYVSDIIRVLAGAGLYRLRPVGELRLKGLPSPVVAWEVDWDPEEEFALRVALADDSVLLREGVASVLEAAGIDVVAQASDAETILRALVAARPHVVILDVRMPPTHTTEGLQAAERIRSEHPDIGVLVLSASVDPSAARRLLQNATDGVGYLLKDRVANIAELTGAIRTIASGGSVIDPEVLARLNA
jgi:class 3 adenylate cyclase/ActR/RegA family two-component response regulator